MASEKAALEDLAPAAAGSGDIAAPVKTPFTTASTAEVATGLAVGQQAYFDFYATSNVHIRFGVTGIGAATASDMFWPAGVRIQKWVTWTHYRVIGDSASGDFYAQRSSP